MEIKIKSLKKQITGNKRCKVLCIEKHNPKSFICIVLGQTLDTTILIFFHTL